MSYLFIKNLFQREKFVLLYYFYCQLCLEELGRLEHRQGVENVAGQAPESNRAVLVAGEQEALRRRVGLGRCDDAAGYRPGIGADGGLMGAAPVVPFQRGHDGAGDGRDLGEAGDG